MRRWIVPGCRAFALALAWVTVSSPLHAADPQTPALMLANRYHPDIDVRDYWVSEKLDGVRAYWDGSRLWTRGGHAIAAPEWYTRAWPEQALDGELWIGRGRFDELSGIVRSLAADDAQWRRVRYMVFDLPADPEPFDTRYPRLRRLLTVTGVAWLQPVEQMHVADAAALQRRLDAVVAAGGEGLMLHRGASRYRARRSDDLLKLKRHDDAEARVVAYQAGRGKYAGMLGALVVEDADGLRFELGTGFSDAQRRAPPPLGSWVTYRYDGRTAAGLPRFARFLRVRHELPPPDPSPAPGPPSAVRQ